jgi:hypothetical protein
MYSTQLQHLQPQIENIETKIFYEGITLKSSQKSWLASNYYRRGSEFIRVPYRTIP